MKTKITILSLMCMLFVSALKAQVDLVPGISYSYTPPGSNGIITDINVDAVNNGSSSAGAFDLAMYLYDMGTGNYWVIGTFPIPSLGAGNIYSITSWDININGTSGIPAGVYRLGIWVDSNDNVVESDETNNAGLLAGNINYTPSGAGVEDINTQITNFSLYPNPAVNNITASFNLVDASSTTIKLIDVTGRLIDIIYDSKELPSGIQTIDYSTEKLANGIYYYSISTEHGTIAKKLVVSK